MRMQRDCSLWPTSSWNMNFLLHRQHAKYSDATKYTFPTATTCLIFWRRLAEVRSSLWQSGCRQFSLTCQSLRGIQRSEMAKIILQWRRLCVCSGICGGYHQSLSTLLRSNSGCPSAFHLRRALDIHLWSMSCNVCIHPVGRQTM